MKTILGIKRIKDIFFGSFSNYDESTYKCKFTSVPHNLNVWSNALITISPGVSPFGLWSICVFFFFKFQLAPHQSTQQRMFLQIPIRINSNRKPCRNWLINMRTQSFQRDRSNFPNKHKASLLAITTLKKAFDSDWRKKKVLEKLILCWSTQERLHGCVDKIVNSFITKLAFKYAR